MSFQRKYFGTDGVRGRVGEEPICPDFVLKLGWAAGHVLTKGRGKGKILIGKDTRISGYMFESALEAGLSAAGMDIYLLGPMPTPAVAYLTRTLHAQAGIVISASHNPYYDNGIKFFSADGFKLPDETELAIENQIEMPLSTTTPELLGKAVRVNDAPGRYIEFCKSTVASHITLNGIKIVVDCANGATYLVAPEVFRELGAEVIEIAVNPDGININDNCGATKPKMLQRMVLAEDADIGIALDGDGDRVILVDHLGEIVDGDEILFIISRCLARQGNLSGGVVGTLMSNLGLELALQQLGIDFVRSKVGDRYVISELLTRNWNLGGETSGHVIYLDAMTTGDGIIAALQVLAIMVMSGKTLNELKSGMEKMPQVMINVRTSSNSISHDHPHVQSVVASVQSRLRNRGRIVLRPSGTEPVIRVMVEGEDPDLVKEMAEEIAGTIENK